MHDRDRGAGSEAPRPMETPRGDVGCLRSRRMSRDRNVPDASSVVRALGRPHLRSSEKVVTASPWAIAQLVRRAASESNREPAD
jgi:hypothetical protein